MSDLILLSTVCFVAMVSPGPDFVLVTKNSLTLPPSRALATALGIISGCFLHATFCTLGLAFIITQNALLFSVVKYAGACYLIFLGIKGLFSRPEATGLALSLQRCMPSFRAAYMQGFLCNILNPKLAVFLIRTGLKSGCVARNSMWERNGECERKNRRCILRDTLRIFSRSMTKLQPQIEFRSSRNF